MARTVQQIRTYVRTYLDVDDTDIPDDLVDAWIAEGQAVILRSRPVWPHLAGTETMTTEADTATYSVTLEKIEGIQGPTSYLTPVEPIWGDRRFTPDVTDSGSPNWWAETAETVGGVNTVTLYPTPSSALSYTVRGFRFPTTPDAATETPDLPDDFHYPLQSYVVMRACHQQNDFEQGQILQQDFANSLGVLLNHYTAQVVRPVVLNRQKNSGLAGINGWMRFPFDPPYS